MKDSLIKITSTLLTENKVSFDKKELAFQIQSHPSYPSLHAITGVLDHFNIENIAAEVPTDIKTLEQLPNSFIAQVTSEKGNELVTVSKKKSQYTLVSNNTKNERISKSDFILKFTGIIVAVEKDNRTNKTQKSNQLKNIILSSFLILLITFLLANKNIQLYNAIFLILTTLGIIISYSILKQELGESSLIGEAFCSSNNDKKDCDAVLNSKGAEIIKNHKLSDLSIIYFTGLLTTGLLINNFDILYIISYLAFPITLYSIYYQYKIIKSWCLLCLSIVLVLWLQTVIAFTQTDTLSININNILISCISFGAVYLSWSLTKPLVKELIQLQKKKIEFVKFKRNFNLFNTLLLKSPKIDTTIEKSNEIIFGNKTARLEIVVITNPFCGHCKPVHKQIHEILASYKDSVKIKIRFNINSKDKNSEIVKITSRLIELYHMQGKEECLNAMTEIYEDGKPETWLKKWGNLNENEVYIKQLTKENQWSITNAINFTPEILINGRSFPKEYKKEDLYFFIEDLKEN